MGLSSCLRRGAAIGLVCGLGACGGPQYVVPSDAHFATGFDTSPMPTPVALPEGVPTRSVMLKSLGISTMPNGATIGGSGIGADCRLSGLLRIGIIDHPLKPTLTWQREFYQVLKAANYRVMGNPDDTFEDTTLLRPDLLLSAAIADQKRNDCYPGNVIAPALPHTAELENRIAWEVFDVAQNKVVLSLTTHGYAKGQLSSDPGQQVVFAKVIEENVQMLAANEQFRALVQARPAPALAETPRAIRLKGTGRLAGAITGNMTKVQASVVTILFAGGHGSGVVVSSDGYILTDRHVVGNASQLTVRTSDGRDIDAAVVAADPHHDVALLKASQPMPNSLPIDMTALSVGSEVYAVGTPLSKDFATSVTKGVVSGYRDVDGLRLIQSDVSIMPGNSGGPLLDQSGNVVGLSRSMVGLGGLPIKTGISFFTPIGDTLQALNVSLARE